MNKLLFLILLAILFITGSCAEKKVTPCDCAKRGQRFLETGISFTQPYNANEIHLIFDGLSLGNFILSADAEYGQMNSPELGFARAADTASITEYIVTHSKKLADYDIKLAWGLYETDRMSEKSGYYALYALKANPIMGVEVIEHAKVTENEFGKLLHLTLTEEGKKLFGDYTTQQVGNFLAITFFDKVLMAPFIQAPITDGKLEISGRFTTEKVHDLAWLINCKLLYDNMGADAYIEAVDKCPQQN